MPTIDINAPKIEGDINIPDANINVPKIEGQNIDLSLNIPKDKIEGDINIPQAEPLNIRTILSGKVEDPIILNKNILNIPDVTVDVKKLKGKKLDNIIIKLIP